MHFRILLGGHYHPVCLKLHRAAVRVLLGVVLVLDKAAFHGAGTITVKDVVEQVGKALVGAGAGAFNATLLLFVPVICCFAVVGTVAAGKFTARSFFARGDNGYRFGDGGVAQFSVGQVFQLPALKGCGEGGRVLAHGHHVLLIGLGQVSKGQVVTANVAELTLTARFEKCIAAGVVVIGHIAVGRQVRLVQVDLVVAFAAALCLVLVDLNDLCLAQVQLRMICYIFFQVSLCSLFSGRITPLARRFLIGIAQFAVSHLALDLVENALCGGVVIFCGRFLIPAGTGILVVAGAWIVVILVVVGDAIHKVRLCASSLYKRFCTLAPFQRGVQQDAVIGLRLSVFLLLRQGQMGIRCQIKVVDVVPVIVDSMLFTVDYYIVSVPPLINLLLRRNTLHLTTGIIPVVRRSIPIGGAGVVFAVLLGGVFQLIQVRSQLGIGHGIIVDHMSHYHGNFFPFHCVVNFQGLDLAVLSVLDDKGLMVLLSFFTGFFQLLEERFLGFFVRAAGGCNLVRLLDFHSQFFFLSNVACRVGLAIFSLVGNGLIFKVQADKVASKLSLDLFLA